MVETLASERKVKCYTSNSETKKINKFSLNFELYSCLFYFYFFSKRKNRFARTKGGDESDP